MEFALLRSGRCYAEVLRQRGARCQGSGGPELHSRSLLPIVNMLITKFKLFVFFPLQIIKTSV